MPSLSDKLRSLGVRIETRETPSPRAACPIDRVVPGRLQRTPRGEVYVSEARYPSDHRHGRAVIGLSSPLRMLTAWARDARLSGVAPPDLAFLDTETTGLMGGTGTYAFLIGVGLFEEDGFRIAQFFMRDPAEEPALLAALADFLRPCRALVTFNGKSFDAPLLNARFVAGGETSPLTALPQIDLLPLARRLWRDRLPSRALGELEAHILGATRTQEDVEGWEIPALYFDYLRTGDARPLGGVFYHNAMDLLAMAGLLAHTAQMLDDPFGEAITHDSDRVAIGRLFDDLGRPDEAAALYGLGLRGDLPGEVRRDTVQRLTALLRRRGDLTSAVAWWREAARERHVYAHVELAKFYEHRRRDFVEAERWARAALALMETPDFPPHERGPWRAELDHRLKRLLKKQGPPTPPRRPGESA